MSDTVLLTRSPLHASPIRTLTIGIGTICTSACALIREWRRRYRSRWELASYSFDQRNDLGFAADLDTEIAKPFWRK
jgi:uncharacterized protein YjiS (DUF1127 family)